MAFTAWTLAFLKLLQYPHVNVLQKHAPELACFLDTAASRAICSDYPPTVAGSPPVEEGQEGAKSRRRYQCVQ